MAKKKSGGVGVFLFAEDGELVDLKCFGGDRKDISEDDVHEQLHNAKMQRRMKRALVSERPPAAGVSTVDVREFVAELAKSC